MKIHNNLVLGALFACVLVPFDSNANEQQLSAEIAAKRGRDTPFGYSSSAAPERVILVVAGKTRSILVKRLETVRIVDGSRSVTWTFDTLGLPLLALPDILPGATKVVINVEEHPMYAN